MQRQTSEITGNGFLVFSNDTSIRNKADVSVARFLNLGETTNVAQIEVSSTLVNVASIENNSDIFVTGVEDVSSSLVSGFYNGLTYRGLSGSITGSGALYVSGGLNSSGSTIEQGVFSLNQEGAETNTKIFENQGEISANLFVKEGFFLVSNKEDFTEVSQGVLFLKDGSLNEGIISQNTINLEDRATFENQGVVSVLSLDVDVFEEIIGENGELFLYGSSSNLGTITQSKIVLSQDASLMNMGNLEAIIENNGSITGIGSVVITGDSFTTGDIENKITINEKLTFNVLENVSLGEITNNGILSLSSEEFVLLNTLSGSGLLNVDTILSLKDEGVLLTQNDLTIFSQAELILNASNLKIENQINNEGKIVFTQGLNENDISGQGKVVIEGEVFNEGLIFQNIEITSGALTTSGDNIYSDVALLGGDLNLQTGVLDTSITGAGNVYILEDVLVTQNASIDSSVNLSVSGALDIDTNTLNLSTLNLLENSTLIISIQEFQDSSQDLSGQINATTINIDSSANLFLNIQVDESLQVGYEKEFTLLTGDISSDFNLENMLSNNRFEVTQTDTIGTYNIAYIATAAEVVATQGGTENHSQISSAWDIFDRINASGSSQNVANTLYNLSSSKGSEQDYLKSLTNTAPTDSDMVVGTSQMLNKQISNQVDKRLNISGLSGGDSVSGRNGGENGRNGGDDFNLESVWAQVLFNVSDQDTSSDTQGYLGKTIGISVGADTELLENFTLGLGYTYSYSQVDSDDREIDVNTQTVFLYAKYQPDSRFVRAVLSYGFSDYDEQKTASDVSFGADYSTHALGADVTTGYNFANGLTPEVGLRYLLVNQETYTDEAGQTVHTPNSDLLTAVVGLGYKKRMNAQTFFFDFTAGVNATYDVITDNVQSGVDIAGQTAYTIQGEEIHRFGTEWTIGAETHFQNWSFNLDYDFGLKENFTSHTVILKAKYDF